ncbi:hypothetical protein ABH926_005162 [Catenulispora sp. GP43]|uniref:hypothetical protein n=1 Tax=Catenulispora sp. GP43 TaxID=3156263 RepID=UPI003512E186
MDIALEAVRAVLGLHVSVNATSPAARPGPTRRLELEAMAKPFGTARIAFTLIPWSDNTLVILDEHPLLGPGARLQGPLSECFLHVRNRRLLTNLARVTVTNHETAHW